MAKTIADHTNASRGASREWLARIMLLAISLVFSLGATEIAIRLFFPIYGGLDNVALDGTAVKEWFAPGSVYRQVSNEYQAITTITNTGHRVPGSEGSPEVIFLGDSFTFGFGLHDDQTFASIYCQRRHVSCANLGIPGSGTSRQVQRLEQFLNKNNWHPREVKLFFFGMSGSFSSGNDFVDNYEFGRRRESQPTGGRVKDAPVPSLASRIIGLQSTLLDNSYLMRRVKFHWGPLLKSLIVDEPGEDRMRDALRYTRQGLQELDDLSQRHGFDYRLYLIVPVQDMLRGSDADTLATLNSVAPKPATTTVPALKDAPSRYYYAFDGHLNPEGARRVADFLVAQDSLNDR